MAIVVLLSSFTVLIHGGGHMHPLHSSQPPQGYTGVSGFYCNACHSGNALNNPGGSVTVNGLPDEGYTPGATYNFSVTIAHSTANRKRYGFSIIAKNSSGATAGSFSSSNANAAQNGQELSHFNAINFSTLSQSYTYNNLTWTAPANPGADDQNITFYFAGNAANGNGSNSGDYIYTGTKNITLAQQEPTYTFTGSGNWSNAANWSNNTLPPATLSGNAHIIINPSGSSECVLDTEQHVTNGATFEVKDGKNFRIAGSLVITE